MILNTGRLFCRLLRTFEITTVCDVGSMDGMDALRFRRMLPRAAIIALEPNPRNFALMAADPALKSAGIRMLPLAASDRRSEAPLFVASADYRYGRDRERRGRSSLYSRVDGSAPAEIVLVQTVRLDDLLTTELSTDEHIALWIDAEGAAFEVIRGAAGIARAVRLIHVEVETEPLIGAQQKRFTQVTTALAEVGFELLATDQPPHRPQFNALFVPREVMRSRAHAVFVWTRIFRLRRIIGECVRPVIGAYRRLNV